MNSFLNKLDFEFEKMEETLPGGKEPRRFIYYARYADDILFCIPLIGCGVMSLDYKHR